MDRDTVIKHIDHALNARDTDFDADAPVGKAVLAADLWVDELIEQVSLVKETAARCLLTGDTDYHHTLAEARRALSWLKTMLGS